MLVVCSNYVSSIKQNLKDYSQHYSQNQSPLPPPTDEKKPALPSEWSFSDTDRITTDHLESTIIESPKTNDNEIKKKLIDSRPPLNHEAFNLVTYKNPANTKMKRHVDEMVKNSTPYLAMRLCPIHKLELSNNLMLSEVTKSKFPFMEKMDEIFSDGIAYDEKIKSSVRKENKVKNINVTNLMEMVKYLKSDEDDDIVSIISD